MYFCMIRLLWGLLSCGCPSVHEPVYCLFVCFVCMSLVWLGWLSVCLPAFLPDRLSVCLFVCLPACLFVSVSLCLCVCLLLRFAAVSTADCASGQHYARCASDARHHPITFLCLHALSDSYINIRLV